MKAEMDFKIIDMKAISEVVREGMKNEDGEPFEGDVPVSSVEAEVKSYIDKEQAKPGKSKFLFDGFVHKTPDESIDFLE